MQGFKPAIFPFLGIEVLLIIPFTRQNGKKSIRTAFFTVLAIGLFYILVVESCIMKVGINDIINYTDPLIVAIRDTAPRRMQFFSRLDILYLTIGFSGIFMGISIVLMAIVEYLCRMFPRARRMAVVISVCVVTYGLFLLASGINGYEDLRNGCRHLARADCLHSDSGYADYRREDPEKGGKKRCGVINGRCWS